ncbi:MAG: hypothetical protein HY744_09610 [Deltaproteobacteria bacterium]|nr:hypothetical protein [Deltaproteobacteria bacterium]
MAKAIMLAGGIVEPGAGAPGAVHAYVAVSVGLAGSRLFVLSGPVGVPAVRELARATTVDLNHFSAETEHVLRPVLEAIEQLGGKAAIARPSPAWVCGQIRDYLWAKEGLEID